MAFRRYGGLNYSAKNNIISNKYTTTDNLTIASNQDCLCSQSICVCGNSQCCKVITTGDLIATGNVTAYGGLIPAYSSGWVGPRGSNTWPNAPLKLTNQNYGPGSYSYVGENVGGGGGYYALLPTIPSNLPLNGIVGLVPTSLSRIIRIFCYFSNPYPNIDNNNANIYEVTLGGTAYNNVSGTGVNGQPIMQTFYPADNINNILILNLNGAFLVGTSAQFLVQIY